MLRKAPATEKCVASITGSRTAPQTKYMKAGLETEASAIKSIKSSKMLKYTLYIYV